ncbi:Serine/arginine-rich splicing factor SC35 [Linum perenne]
MSHFGRSGPPDIADTYSLLVLNITFRTTADDLFPLFDKYGKVVDIFIPRDRRTGDSRGFAFVRYKYADEAQKAVERLDGRVVDGREITVQFAKYGPNAEKIQKGRIIEPVSRSRNGSRSCSPRRSPRRRRSRSRSISPDYARGRGRGHYDDKRRSASRSISRSPRRRSPVPRRSVSPQKVSPKDEILDRRNQDARSRSPRSISPQDRPIASRSPSPRNSDAEE